MSMIVDITNTYARHLGYRGVDGERADPIIPFFILDVSNTLFRNDILPLKGVQESKKAVKDWAKCYHGINSDFFRSLTDEQQDYIIEAMDDFENFIANDVMIVRVAFMNLMSDKGIALEAQQVLSSCLTCNILAQCAQIVWTEVFNGLESKGIKGIIHYSDKWMKIYFRGKSECTVNPNEDKEVERSVDALCNKIARYIKQLS